MAKNITTIPVEERDTAQDAALAIPAILNQAARAVDHAQLRVNAAIRQAGGRQAAAGYLSDAGYTPADLAKAYNTMGAMLTALGAKAHDLEA